MTAKPNNFLIENDEFPFEFVSQLAEKESWRKEIHRPIYHLHKWWAKRLGSIFRSILLASALPFGTDLKDAFYKIHSFNDKVILDPFMGSGTTIGEAHKLGFTALGRDINPVAVESVKVAFSPLNSDKIQKEFEALSEGVGEKIRQLYKSQDSKNRECDVLYFFWAMQLPCPTCSTSVGLFPSWVISKNAYPQRKPEIQILCPSCGDIFRGLYGETAVACRSCKFNFDPNQGNSKGAKATCPHCKNVFSIIEAINKKPDFRLYGKLVLTSDGKKEYLPVDEKDHKNYRNCQKLLKKELADGKIILPSLSLKNGYNTDQAMRYGFSKWRDFFNDRQLLALGWLQSAIGGIKDPVSKKALANLFSGVLEFNNMFASYKGEGTGAVRHMFSHHILKPERMPIEANLWGSQKSSGSFSNLFRSRLISAIKYRSKPTEINSDKEKDAIVSSLAFSQEALINDWPANSPMVARAVYLSCGDSALTNLRPKSVDLVITDPPFFDNVQYSELADFFYAWQQLNGTSNSSQTTRNDAEVQDSNADDFSRKLQGVFSEMHRVLKDEGLLVFTYHHSRQDGWSSLVKAIVGSGFHVINSHPVKSEMSSATPKSQAKEPIQLDVILVCRKFDIRNEHSNLTKEKVVASAKSKIRRLGAAGLQLSKNDENVVFYGELLKLARSSEDTDLVTDIDYHKTSRSLV